MIQDSKQFISYKDIKEGVEVNGFLDETTFCGSFVFRLSNGRLVSKRGVFKKVHTFPRENFSIDFTKYIEQ